MGKIQIVVLDTETTRDDELTKTLIGTVWEVAEVVPGGIWINAYDGFRLEDGEYAILEDCKVEE